MVNLGTIFYRVEGGDAHWKLLATCSHREEQSLRKVVGLLGHESQIGRYTPLMASILNAPMMFMPEETVVTTGGRYIQILGVLLIILGKLSTHKISKIKITPNVHKNAKKM